MNEKRIFPQAARIFSLSSTIATLFIVILAANGENAFLFPFAIMIFSVAAIVINRMILKKERTISSIVVINIIMAGAAFGICLALGAFPVFWMGAFGLIAFMVITAATAVSCINPPKLSSVLLALDGNIVLLLFLVLILSYKQLPFSYSLFAIAGVIAGLLAAISFRMEKGIGRRESIIILTLFILIAFVAWLLFSFVVSPLSTGAVGAGRQIAIAFTFIWNEISRFFKWLATLWHDDEGGAAVQLATSQGEASNGEAQLAEDNGLMSVIVLILIIVAAVVVFILILKKTGRKKISKAKAVSKSEAFSSGQIPFSLALRKLINRIKRRMNAKKYLRNNKRSPEGIYFTLKKICIKTDFEEKEGDTPSEFLGRLKLGFAEGSQAVSQIDELTVKLNENLYSSKIKKTEHKWAGSLMADTKKMVKRKEKDKEN